MVKIQAEIACQYALKVGQALRTPGIEAIEDTLALFEARQRSIHPFCITIDAQARDFLAHGYGDADYVAIDYIKMPPYRNSDIYRGLTS